MMAVMADETFSDWNSATAAIEQRLRTVIGRYDVAHELAFTVTKALESDGNPSFLPKDLAEWKPPLTRWVVRDKDFDPKSALWASILAAAPFVADFLSKKTWPSLAGAVATVFSPICLWTLSIRRKAAKLSCEQYEVLIALGTFKEFRADPVAKELLAFLNTQRQRPWHLAELIGVLESMRQVPFNDNSTEPIVTVDSRGHWKSFGV
jgi:hypothetical protein